MAYLAGIRNLLGDVLDRKGSNVFLTTRSLQDNFCGKNSSKSIHNFMAKRANW